MFIHDFARLLCKPLSVECTMKNSVSAQSLMLDVSMGQAELVEGVFDRRGATASIMGFHLPIENVLPEYCEVSA